VGPASRVVLAGVGGGPSPRSLRRTSVFCSHLSLPSLLRLANGSYGPCIRGWPLRPGRGTQSGLEGGLAPAADQASAGHGSHKPQAANSYPAPTRVLQRVCNPPLVGEGLPADVGTWREMVKPNRALPASSESHSFPRVWERNGQIRSARRERPVDAWLPVTSGCQAYRELSYPVPERATDGQNDACSHRGEREWPSLAVNV